MGNKFGNFASYKDAADAIIADGFKMNARGFFAKQSTTGGNLMEQPRRCTALVEITSYRVSGQYAPDGQDYLVYQHHFI